MHARNILFNLITAMTKGQKTLKAVIYDQQLHLLPMEPHGMIEVCLKEIIRK